MRQSSKGVRGVSSLVASLAAVGCMWLAWFVAWAAVGDPYVVPPVGETVGEIFALFGSADYWLAFGMTLSRAAAAWALSCAVALALAALSAVWGPLRAFLSVFVAVMRTLPVMAVTLMLLIWSSRTAAPIIVASLTLVPITYAQFMAAYDGIDCRLVEMAAVYRLPPSVRLFRIYLPQALPPVLAQAGANLSLSLKVVISAEVLSSTFRSLGGMISEANMFLRTSQMFALTVTVLAAGGLIEWLFSHLKLITAKWSGEEQA